MYQVNEHSLCFVWWFRDLGFIRCFIFEKYISGFEASLEQYYIVYMFYINLHLDGNLRGNWNYYVEEIYDFKWEFLKFCLYFYGLPLFNNLLYKLDNMKSKFDFNMKMRPVISVRVDY